MLWTRTLHRNARHGAVLGVLLAWAGPVTSGRAQEVDLSTEAYIEPPAAILEAVTAPWHDNVSLSNLSPDGTHFLVTISDGMVPLSRMARPYVNLGETTIDHIARRSRSLTTRNSAGLELRIVEDNETRRVQTPDGARISGARFSPDGSKVAYLALFEDSTHIFVADVATGRSSQVTRQPVNAALVSSFDWAGDSQRILTVLVPRDQGDMPQPPAVASEPQVRINREGRTTTRVYRFLMKSPFDFELYEWLTTGQLALVNVDDRSVQTIGAPKMYRSIDVAPTGDLVRVTTVLKPFVYYATASGFGTVEEIWNTDGEIIHEVRRRELEPSEDEIEPVFDVDTAAELDQLMFEFGRDLDLDAFEEQQRAQRSQRGGQSGQAEENDEMRSIAWRPDGQGISFLQLEPKPEEDAADDVADDNGDAARQNQPRRGAGSGRRGQRGQRPPQRQQQQQQQQVTFLGIPIPAKQDRAEQDVEQEAEEEQPPRKDRLLQWVAPYGEENKQVVYETEGRISSVRYSDDCRWLFITETKDNERSSFAMNLDDPERTKHKLRGGGGGGDRGLGGGNIPPQFRNRGGDGGSSGSLMSRSGPLGVSAVRMSTDGASVYYSGTVRPGEDDEDDEQDEAEEQRPRPFIDRYELASGEAERIFEGDGSMTERLGRVVGDDIAAVFTTRESRKDVPNTFRHELGDEVTVTQLTENIDYLPDITQAKRERFQVTRVDGFRFWVNVTIPRDYGKELPAMIWFYPREFTTQEQYDQRAGRGGRSDTFRRVGTRSMDILIRHGYVVVQPDLPIVGAEGRMNDNYVQDLRNGLWAVIDELDKREIIDRDRLGLGGHSYGAFGTANAMVHTPFFKAGIAGDGNYNRTLTPMAFQAERRLIWDARETYLRMSPLLWANQFNGALLMYHGIEDPNTGTHPFHAIRMFEALDGLGKDVALYRYHYQTHGPVARETILDQWARWVRWLDKYVKHAGVEEE